MTGLSAPEVAGSSPVAPALYPYFNVAELEVGEKASRVVTLTIRGGALGAAGSRPRKS
jgi:hypothetical protein